MNFESYKNIRDLGGRRLKSGGMTRYGVFARSNLALTLGGGERDRLRSLGFTTVIDLRTPEETVRYPHPLEGAEGFTYAKLSLDYWLRDCFHTPSESAAYYHMLLDFHANVRAVMEALAGAPGGAIFNCYAGKDRTGVVSALLFLAAGACDDEIIDDYHATLANLWPGIDEGSLIGEKLVPHSEVMRIFLEVFRAKYGDIGGYFDAAGISRRTLDTLGAKLAGDN